MMGTRTGGFAINSGTAGAAMALIAGFSVNSATVTKPWDIKEVGGANVWSTPDNVWRSVAAHAEARKPVFRKKELSALGQRLLALRNAAIAAGMPTRAAEEIIEELRAARDA